MDPKNQDIVVGRHCLYAFADQYKATILNFRGKGNVNTRIRRRGTGHRNRARGFDAPDAGVVMAMYNLDKFHHRLARAG